MRSDLDGHIRQKQHHHDGDALTPIPSESHHHAASSATTSSFAVHNWWGHEDMLHTSLFISVDLPDSSCVFIAEDHRLVVSFTYGSGTCMAFVCAQCVLCMPREVVAFSCNIEGRCIGWLVWALARHLWRDIGACICGRCGFPPPTSFAAV